MKRCVFEYHTDTVSMYSLGNYVDYEPSAEMPGLIHVHQAIGSFWRSLKEAQRPKRTFWQRLPGIRHPKHARRILTLSAETKQHLRGWVVMNDEPADGVCVSQRGTAVALTSRDCPYLILWFLRENQPCVLVLHCGRDQLHNVAGGNATESVIGNAIRKAIESGVEIETIRGLITMGIRARYFTNERYPEITEALRKYWGESVVPDSEHHTINLEELILRQLEEAGILRENIGHDGLDTYGDPRLASLRAGRGGHNMVIVHLKP